MFEVDRLRDVISAATGRPADKEAWGTRISGGDSLHFAIDLPFDDLGKLCNLLSEAYNRTDYQEQFAWLDFVRPVGDPEAIQQLEGAVVETLTGTTNDFELTPPEIVEWDRVAGFRFHFDARAGVTHPDLRLADYLRGLRRCGELDTVDAALLRRRHISAVDDSGEVVYRWTVWRCLAGEFEFAGDTYVLDEGSFFVVARDYLQQLHQELVQLLPEASIVLPSAGRRIHEDEYNKQAVGTSSDYLLLDRDTISTSAATTPVEVCDILTRGRQLIHVKRHLSSRELSHLFSQGFVSATLMQENPEFRAAVQEKIDDVAGSNDFLMIDQARFATSDYEVIFAIIANWNERSLTGALPFFSKINLLRTAKDLSNRGFRVSYYRIPLAEL